MSHQTKRNITLNLWTARAIPVVLTGVVGYATYVLVVLLAVNYLLVKHHDKTAAIPILIIYFILFLMMATSFCRLLYITTFHPPYVPRGPNVLRGLSQEKAAKVKTIKAEKGVGGTEYGRQNDLGDIERGEVGRQNDPDSPGLELFYSKDVFVCELDGKPKYCAICDNWKPDRAHHCSTSGRCILRMDHFCPWVGGPIGENNVKFFIQFVSYTALYCLFLLVITAFYISKQTSTEGESIDRNYAAILGLAGFFFIFTAGMSLSSTNFALLNVTQVEHLGLATRVYDLAVLKPNQTTPPASGSYIREITYPLPIGIEKSRHDKETETSEVPDQRLVTGDISHSNAACGERLSERDLRATRSFAVLRTEHGENLWDLGSYLLNWETIMGTNPIDWFLPIRRSPCCNHEDQESFYFLGPTIDLMRSRVGMINMSDVRIEGGRKRTETPDPKRRYRFLKGQRKIEEARTNRYKQPDSETPSTSNNASRTRPGFSIEMNHLDGQASTPAANPNDP